MSRIEMPEGTNSIEILRSDSNDAVNITQSNNTGLENRIILNDEDALVTLIRALEDSHWEIDKHTVVAGTLPINGENVINVTKEEIYESGLMVDEIMELKLKLRPLPQLSDMEKLLKNRGVVGTSLKHPEQAEQYETTAIDGGLVHGQIKETIHADQLADMLKAATDVHFGTKPKGEIAKWKNMWVSDLTCDQREQLQAYNNDRQEVLHQSAYVAMKNILDKMANL